MRILGFGKTNHERIEYIQSKYGIVFPREYIDFLTESNGGIVKYNSSPEIGFSDSNESIRVKGFFGIGVDGFDIEFYNDKFKDDLEKAFIIGFDYNKGYIVFYKNDVTPLICYWDEEQRLSVSSEDGNAYIMANSFNEFINLVGGFEYLKTQEGENIMNKVDYYPIGSIVLLEGAFKKLMVTSRGLVVKKDDKELFFDYAGVPYPEGLVDDKIAYFNHESISKVIFEGYRDDDDTIAINNIHNYIDKHPELEMGNSDNWEK